MKEKTSDIDILEEKEKKAIEFLIKRNDFMGDYRTDLENNIDIVLDLVSTLIAENKGLKEEKLGKLYYEANENCIKYEKLIENSECDMSTNYIRKSIVEEKIDELEKIKQKDEVDEFGIHSRDWWVADIVQEQFKELLDERNNTDE